MSAKPIITLIAAMDRGRVIAAGDEMPWHLGDDLRRFRQLTVGKPIIMGRKTFEAVGRPLPGRHNIIMTRRPDYVAEGIDVAHSPAEALQLAGDVAEIMIGGGGLIYELFLPRADKLILTQIDADVEGDIYFPAFLGSEWCEVWRESYQANERNDFAFDIVEYHRCPR